MSKEDEISLDEAIQMLSKVFDENGNKRQSTLRHPSALLLAACGKIQRTTEFELRAAIKRGSVVK